MRPALVGAKRPRRRPTPTTTLITYRRRAVAIAGPERFYLAPHIAQRHNGDPLKRFVCFLALHARDVQTGQLPGEPHHYRPHRGERYAREALIPPHEFAAIAHRPDHELAEHFVVPLEQIAHRRADLADEPRGRRGHASSQAAGAAASARVRGGR